MNYQETAYEDFPAPEPASMRSGADRLVGMGEFLTKPEWIDPVDLECTECGQTYSARRWQTNSRFPGKPVIHVVGGGRCPECWRKVREEEERQAEAQRQLKIAGSRRAMRLNCGIPSKYQDQDFSTFIHTGDRARYHTAFEAAWAYAEGFPLEARGRGYRSLVFFSHNSWGVGKTHLCAAIAHRILDRWNGPLDYGCPVRMISEYDLLSRITASYNYSPEERQLRQSEDDIIREMMAVPLLIIDDVAKRRVRDLRFVQRILFSIIDARDNAMRPIVMTANVDAEGLGLYLGGVDPWDPRGQDGDQATLDRLIGMCDGRFVQLEGKSYRRERGGGSG
jgi:DNA replication protein DnaC